ncbi:MAG: DNA polymerase IV, partial [Planctomycetota bacterium]
SVEQLDDPSLRGRPVLVGGDGKRGVVAAASYEARVFGCRSAQPMVIARRLCPDAVVVRGNFDRYREVSAQVFEILHTATPLVQPLSIDEAFCDVSGSIRLLGEPRAIAEDLRSRIKSETGLTASVGIAPNKFLAKLASDLDKPDGLVVITPETIRSTLDPLPITRLWGVGPSAERKLIALGLRTIGDVAMYPESTLVDRFGDFGAHIARLARGEDDRPVVPDREAKSISHEQTFSDDLEDPADVRAVMTRQAEDVSRRLRKHGRAARTVTVKIRFGDFETVTRSHSLGEPADRTSAIRDAAIGLFDAWAAKGYRPVRLIGVGVSQLGGKSEQAGLFDQAEKKRDSTIDAVADRISEKFGKGAIRRGSSIRKDER